MTIRPPVLGAVLCLAASLGPPALQEPSPARVPIGRVFNAYASGDDQIIASTLAQAGAFESLRSQLDALDGWSGARPHAAAVFMLDLAIGGHDRHEFYWLDVLKSGRTFVTHRADPPGRNPGEDAFEIAWHKTALALLEGLRRPDFVADHGVEPLAKRMAAVPAPAGAPRLIDPWIELARGFEEEGFTLTKPETLTRLAFLAIDHYNEAAKYDATRAEAVLRKAWLQLRLKQAADALVTLEAFRDAWTDDLTIRYWYRLFHGRVLEALGRLDEAARAYDEALALVPDAQSPRVARMILDLRRGQQLDARSMAETIRTAPEAYTDPFWLYPYGDRRFLVDRLRALRAAARR